MTEMHENAIVKLQPGQGLCVFVMNILFCGVGTMLSGFLSGGDNVINNLLVGLLQIVLYPFLLVGWFWSIYLGYCIYAKSKEEVEKF